MSLNILVQLQQYIFSLPLFFPNSLFVFIALASRIYSKVWRNNRNPIKTKCVVVVYSFARKFESSLEQKEINSHSYNAIFIFFYFAKETKRSEKDEGNMNKNVLRRSNPFSSRFEYPNPAVQTSDFTARKIHCRSRMPMTVELKHH